MNERQGYEFVDLFPGFHSVDQRPRLSASSISTRLKRARSLSIKATLNAFSSLPMSPSRKIFRSF